MRLAATVRFSRFTEARTSAPDGVNLPPFKATEVTLHKGAGLSGKNPTFPRFPGSILETLVECHRRSIRPIFSVLSKNR
ncbi:MAG: hypothetical protein CMI30_01540 [Opitutae bacterium]|nr:hypothetical protein [Opitutae bacterium]